ncbi:MAG: DNA repair protein RadC [Prevotella sp.]|nr:DNA repair protein RadC [Prevotella sp.]
MEKLNINQWSADDRPREKFMERGPEALTNAELLAILIGSGNTKETAVDLMKRILADCDDKLHVLGRKTMEELTGYNGIGTAKAITILAACELGRRRQSENVDRLRMDSASSIYLYLHPKMQDLDVEQAWVLLMNQNFKLIKAERLSIGGISETSIDVRQVLKLAVINNATVLAIAHNHPSNNPSPSREDDRITERMKKACEIMRIHFLDHVIVTDGQFYSYHEQGRL